MIALRMRLLGIALLVLAGVSPVTAAEPSFTAEDWYRAGERARLLKDYDKAQARYAAALLIDSDHYHANVRLAWVYNEKKEYVKAGLFALKAITLDAGNSAGWRELGYAEWKLGDLDEAEKSLVLAVACDPTDGSAKGYLKAVREGKTSRDSSGADL